MRRSEVLAGWVVLGSVAVVTSLVDPAAPGRYPTCPFRWLTGLDCPGCGSLRAMRDLAQGNLLGALDHNAALVVALVVAAVSSVQVLLRPDAERLRPGRGAVPAVVAALVIWTVARNLPGAALLSSAP